MREKYFILSNNNLVRLEYPVMWVSGDFDAVLTTARDLIHKGHKLLSHPLTGSIKPHETEYKSILITHKKYPMDFESLKYIENALETSKRFKTPIRNWTEEQRAQVNEDFQVVDLALITSGIEAMDRGLYELVEPDLI